MSGASDKARFYLEKAVPQLQEFEQKKIFTKEEIRTLVKKRSTFEHKVLARGSVALDFARYAAWEISLEALRSKRCKRLGIKTSSARSSQGRIFQIFDRGTRKHPGDLALWMSYLEFARSAKATKKFKTALTAALRLHCTNAALWLYAAKSALESDNDVNATRGYLARGMRFCKGESAVWIEYARVEMIYLARIAKRRTVLGLDQGGESVAQEEDNVVAEKGFEDTEDVIRIPDFAAELPKTDAFEEAGVAGDTQVDAPKDLMATPALNGAIPLAIFSDAQRQSFYNASVAEKFFNMFSLFPQVPCLFRILEQVVESMRSQFPKAAATGDCFVRQATVGIHPKMAEFPMALHATLERLNIALEETSEKDFLVKKTKGWMEKVLEIEDLDEGIEKVLRFRLRKLVQ